MIYPGLYSGAIGTLLRQIQEQKSSSPIVPAATETSSPIRAGVQEPLQAPESPGTSRVVSVRPEASNVAGAGSPVGSVTPTRSSVGPISIGGEGQPFAQAPVQSSSVRAVAINEPGANPVVPSNGNTIGNVAQPDANKNNAPIKAVEPALPVRSVTPSPLPPVPTAGAAPDTSKVQGAIAKADAADQAYNERINQLEGPNAYNYLSSGDQKKVTQEVKNLLQTAKNNQPASTPKPTPTQSQPQVLGASTQKQQTPWYAQSPISWLATKLFGW